MSIGLEFKTNVLCKSIASKKQSIWYELYLKEYLIAEGTSGSSGWTRAKLCVLGSFVLSRANYWRIYTSFEITLEWECPLDWNTNPMFYATIASKKHSIWYELYFKKILNCKGHLGEHERPDMERKWRARVNNLNQWSGWWHKYTKATKVMFYNANRNRSLGLGLDTAFHNLSSAHFSSR